VNDELERVGEEVVIMLVEILSSHLPGGIEKNHENLKSGTLVSRIK
jgi:hypothetical protein